MSEPDNETYPDGPGWVTPGYPYLPPQQPERVIRGQVVRYTGQEPPTNPNWVIRGTPEPVPDLMHADRRRGLRLAGILITLVVVLGVTAMIAFRVTGH